MMSYKKILLPGIIGFLFSAIFACSESTDENTKTNDSEPPTIDSARVERINSYKHFMDSINETLEWKELKCGLWLSNNNMLALKTQKAASDVTFMDRYITECGEQQLITLIDTSTFTQLGRTFYKDANHIYVHYINSDGGFLSIVENVDIESFRVLAGDYYAKDKHHIFTERGKIMKNADYTTFRPMRTHGFIGKDKNGYFQWGDKVKLEDMGSLPDGMKERLIEL